MKIGPLAASWTPVCFRMHPYAPVCIRMHPLRIRTHPYASVCSRMPSYVPETHDFTLVLRKKRRKPTNRANQHLRKWVLLRKFVRIRCPIPNPPKSHIRQVVFAILEVGGRAVAYKLQALATAEQQTHFCSNRVATRANPLLTHAK